MAYRRNLTTRARIIAQQRFASSFSHLHHEDDRRMHHSDEKAKSFLPYGRFGNTNTCLGFGRGRVSFQSLNMPMTASRLLLARNMSTGASEKIENMVHVADRTMEVVSPALSEVAVAAADSWLTVAALQYAVGEIHNFTGLNWWASISITTLVIQALALPIRINQTRAAARLYNTSLELDQIKKELKAGYYQGKSLPAEDGFKEIVKRVLKKHGASLFAPFKWHSIYLAIFVSYFFAIWNMAEKVPSFKTGGPNWFLDLTTADSFYVLSFLVTVSSLVHVELNTPKGFDDNLKKVFVGSWFVGFAIAAFFPKALFCYWITADLFSLVFALIMKQPPVRKFLNIPEIGLPPTQGIPQRTGDPEDTVTSQSMTWSTPFSQNQLPTSEKQHKSTHIEEYEDQNSRETSQKKKEE